MQISEVTHAPQQHHVIRDHRVTRGVTSPTQPQVTCFSCPQPYPRFKREWVAQRASRCSSFQAAPPRVLHHHHPALRQFPWPLRAGSMPLHAASAPLTCALGQRPRTLGQHPRPCALGRYPRPLRTGSASPARRAVWTHPAPASAPMLVLVPPR